MQNEKRCLMMPMMPISYIARIQSSHYIITVMVEFTLKNGA